MVMILAGAALSLYPVVENVYHDWQGLSVVDDYSQRVAAAPAPVLEGQLQAAEQYNADLTPSALNDPWDDEQAASSPQHDAYVQKLAGFGPLGRIRVPSVEIDLPIFHDATKHSLGLGAGHMYGTSLPVGGTGSHSVIAGHTGATIRTYFNRLNEAVEGDLIHIDSLGETLTYRVDLIQVVSKSDLSQIQPVDGADLVTLVTCIPGHKSDRLLVRGVRFDPTEATGAQASVTVLDPAALPISVQGWMVPRLGIAGGALLLALAMLIMWLVSDARTRSTGTHREQPAPESAQREDALP